MKIRILTVLAICVSCSAFSNPHNPETSNPIDKWIEGYLFDFHEQMKFLEGKYPMIVETYDYSKKKTKTNERVINDGEQIREITKLILEDVNSKIREENWIDEEGIQRRRITMRSHVHPQIRLKWNIDGMIVGFQFDANGIEIYHKYDSKKSQIFYQKRSCSEDLGTKIIKKLQQDGGEE